MRVELAGELREIADGLRGHALERGDIALDFAVRGAGLLRHFIHRSHEIGNASDQRALDFAHILVSAAEDLLQQN
ncbi:MAG: hypothetical protein E6G96_13225, partial [Alphaproteobacteria bacterium]